MVIMFWTGCAHQAPIQHPSEVVVTPEEAKRNEVLSHLLGSWEKSGKAGASSQMIFGPDGQLTFKGGLGFFNPGRWELDVDRQELKITLPQAEDDKLQIFKLYIGDGVKALDRPNKQVTYNFNAETWNLNVGGWIYSKVDAASAPTPPAAEPVFK